MAQQEEIKSSDQDHKILLYQMVDNASCRRSYSVIQSFIFSFIFIFSFFGVMFPVAILNYNLNFHSFKQTCLFLFF